MGYDELQEHGMASILNLPSSLKPTVHLEVTQYIPHTTQMPIHTPRSLDAEKRIPTLSTDREFLKHPQCRGCGVLVIQDHFRTFRETLKSQLQILSPSLYRYYVPEY